MAEKNPAKASKKEGEDTLMTVDEQVSVQEASPGQAELNEELNMEGWTEPNGEGIPRPTYWPVVMALSITFIAFGFITSLIITGIGTLLFIVALVGWIGEIFNERRENENGEHE
jgi:hypothetical protein